MNIYKWVYWAKHSLPDFVLGFGVVLLHFIPDIYPHCVHTCVGSLVQALALTRCLLFQRYFLFIPEFVELFVHEFHLVEVFLSECVHPPLFVLLLLLALLLLQTGCHLLLLGK